ncbi:MAG: hypothetical protein L7S64_01390, partial [Longimicrobiales bacterium]|nr:hypothetical protein [Longimicrobiales bacterium]
ASMGCLDAIMAVYAEESGLRTALHRPLPHTEERCRSAPAGGTCEANIELGTTNRGRSPR